jgi:uncharacterized protein with PIN domain
MAQRLSYVTIYDRIRMHRDGTYVLITKNDLLNPIKSRTILEIQHIPCGTVINSHYQDFLNENEKSCPKCHPIIRISNTTPLTLENVKKRLLERFNNEVVYVSGWENRNTKFKVRHKCGTEYDAKIGNLLDKRGKTCCPVCSNASRGKYQSSLTYLDDIIVSGYKWLEKYKGDNKAQHFIKHINCGHIYKVRPNDFQQGYRCPKCNTGLAPNESRNVKRIKGYLEELGIEFKMEYIDKRCKSDLNGQLRFDFAIPHLEGKYLIIEYDGEFHDGNLIPAASEVNYSLTSKISKSTLRRDRIKDQFVKNHPESYIGLHRITHRQPLKKALFEILSMYYDF